MVCLLREKNQLEQVQICSQLEIILTFSRKCLFYRIFTLPNFTLVPLLCSFGGIIDARTCSLLICILVNRKNFFISLEGGLCYNERAQTHKCLCSFQGIFGATGLIHVAVCKCAPTPFCNIWNLDLSPF